MATTEQKRYAAKVTRRLKKEWPDAECSLRFKSPLELLVATILSAQCTDKRVNEVTVDLFKKYRSAADYADAPLDDLKEAIRSTGFFNNKAKNIQACCKALVEQHNGEIPDTLEELVKLAGIGRKTANVILGVAMRIASGVVVDTHVGRISRRLGLTAEKNPEKVERELMEQFPKKEWIDLSHRMIKLGREYCIARRPKCDEGCPMEDICPRIGVES